MLSWGRVSSYIFQSTHPVRGATDAVVGTGVVIHISIHAPREGCDQFRTEGSQQRGISIHAPREGCDEGARPQCLSDGISIHAPREGCDPRWPACPTASPYFNPRTP